MAAVGLTQNGKAAEYLIIYRGEKKRIATGVLAATTGVSI